MASRLETTSASLVGYASYFLHFTRDQLVSHSWHSTVCTETPRCPLSTVCSLRAYISLYTNCRPRTSGRGVSSSYIYDETLSRLYGGNVHRSRGCGRRAVGGWRSKTSIITPTDRQTVARPTDRPLPPSVHAIRRRRLNHDIYTRSLHVSRES